MASVGVQYTAIRAATFSATYQCSQCEHTSPVQVAAVANATTNASHLLGNYEAAKARAAETATAAIPDEARLALLLVRCPACGRRDKRAYRRLLLGAIAKAVGIGVMTFSIVAFVTGGSNIAVLLAAGGILAMVAVALWWWASGPLDRLQLAQMGVKFPQAQG